MIAQRLSMLWILVALVAGCDEAGKSAAQTQRTAVRPIATPDLASTIGELRKARDTLEGYGNLVKNEIRRNDEGQLLYTKAMSCHNGCLTYIAVGLDTGLHAERLRQNCQEADIARTNLIAWYNQHRRPKRTIVPPRRDKNGSPCAFIPDLAASFLVGLVGEFLDYDTKLRALEQQARATQIDRIKQELKDCQCRQWNQL
jgi:hypothetical protein